MNIAVSETCHLHTESVYNAAASSETVTTVNKNTVSFINIFVSNIFLRRNVGILKIYNMTDGLRTCIRTPNFTVRLHAFSHVIERWS